MSLFSAIRDVFRNEATATPGTPAQMSVGGFGGYNPAGAPATVLDDFGQEWLKVEFFEGLSMRAGTVYFPKSPHTNIAMLAEIDSKAKGLITPEAKQRLDALEARLDRVHQMFCDNDFLRASTRFRASVAEVVNPAVHEGKQPPAFSSLKETIEQCAHTRKALHSEEAQIRQEALADIREACDRYYAAGKKIVAEIKAKQQGGFARFRVNFKPDALLLAWVYVVAGAHSPVRDFERGSGILPVSSDIKKIWGHLFGYEVVSQRPATRQEVRDRDRKEAREITQRHEAARLELEQAERARQLEEINKFNDAIRNGASIPSINPGTNYKPKEEKKP